MAVEGEETGSSTIKTSRESSEAEGRVPAGKAPDIVGYTTMSLAVREECFLFMMGEDTSLLICS